jgi:hypothetical protein
MEPPHDSRFKLVEAVVHNWSGGSVRNIERDLIAVARAMLHEAAIPPLKAKEELATRMAPAHYGEGCYLLDRMKEKGLIDFVSGRCEVVPMGEPDLERKLSELREYYAHPENFPLDFKQARLAFTDIHQFRIDYTAWWISLSVVRKVLIILLAVIGAMGSSIAIVEFIKQWLKQP